MNTVELFYDYASPYSFLANETLATKLPGVEIVYRPVYLRGFDAFKTGIPYGGAKLAWLIKDLQRCAAELGLALQVPASFPVNGLYALRGAIAAQRTGCFARYHTEVFRAVWQRGTAIGSRDAVAALAGSLGCEAVAPLLDDAAIKDQLKANTTEAIARGAFGVPALFAGSELFWGHDRMHQLAAHLAASR